MISSIPKKEANLFVKSEISKKYPWLTSSMIENHKFPHLRKNEFNKLSQEHQEFLNLRWEELLGLAQSEWIVKTKFIKNENNISIDCELCGHKELDLLSEIENLENGTILIIGSTCIENFDKIRNNSITDYKQYIKDKKIKAKIISNEEYLEKTFSGIISTIIKFRQVQNDDSIILNKELDTEYKKILYIIDTDYENELRKPTSKINLDIINSTYLMVQEFLNNLQIYRDNCRKNIWGIKPEIAKWSNQYGTNQLIFLLKNSGEINIYTVDQIEEPSYLNNTIRQFEELFKINNIKLIKCNGKLFSISFNVKNNIIINVKTTEFIKNNKDFLFKSKKLKIDMNDILKIGKIDMKSYHNVAYYLYKNSNLKIYYEFYYDDSGINEISFINKISKNIYVLEYDTFINKFQDYIYNNKINNDKNHNLLNYFEKNSKKYEKTEYKNHLKQLGIRVNK